MITIYGLKNCDTCRKALKWLKAESLEHHFIDVRVEALKSETITRWISIVGWEVLLNQRGTTWRTLRDTDKHTLGKDNSIALMSEHPALIKRPVFELNEMVLVGFKDDVRETLKGLKNG
jgi:Spx/MgsR family transcriptional regulator